MGHPRKSPLDLTLRRCLRERLAYYMTREQVTPRELEERVAQYEHLPPRTSARRSLHKALADYCAGRKYPEGVRQVSLAAAFGIALGDLFNHQTVQTTAAALALTVPNVTISQGPAPAVGILLPFSGRPAGRLARRQIGEITAPHR